MERKKERKQRLTRKREKGEKGKKSSEARFLGSPKKRGPERGGENARPEEEMGRGKFSLTKKGKQGSPHRRKKRSTIYIY